MQTLEPRLDFGTIARNPTESVRPDLWPDHACIPALGSTGGQILDVISGGRAAAPQYSYWDAEGIANNTDSANPSGVLASVDCTGDFTFAAKFFLFTQSRFNNYIASAGTAPLLNAANTNPTHSLVIANASSSIPVSDYTWYSLAVTVGGATGSCDLAINGKTYTSVLTSAVPQSLLDLYVMGGTGSKYYNTRGILSSFQFYNRKLSIDQLATISADPLIPFRRAPQVSYFVAAAGLVIPIIINQARRRRT